MNFLKVLAEGVRGGVDLVTPPGGSPNPDLPGMISKVTTFIFTLLGVVAVFVIILGGFNMMTSSGDPGKVKKGKDTILWGIIGLVVAILAYAIINFVLTQLGL